MSGQYDDIIHLPHHVSLIRPQMPMQDRAAQFSPFAALTGYDAAVKETARLTDEKIVLDEEALTFLNRKYQILVDRLDERSQFIITYFKPDAKKSGGAYAEIAGAVKKVDDFERIIVMMDGTKLPMDDVLDIEGEIFTELL
jgi:hypothetical protein